MDSWQERRRSARRHRLETAIADERAKLAALKVEDYPSPGSYQRAVAHYQAKIRRLGAVLRDMGASVTIGEA